MKNTKGQKPPPWEAPDTKEWYKRQAEILHLEIDSLREKVDMMEEEKEHLLCALRLLAQKTIR